MVRRTRFVQYLRVCVEHVAHVREIFVGLLTLVLACGVIIAWVERLRLGEAIYFAFVTALTSGYGDIHPETTIGRIVSIFVGFVGLILTGLTVAVFTRALADTVREPSDAN